VLSRDEAGDYWLRTPVEEGRIEVEDAPFTVVDMDRITRDDVQYLRFTTNLDDLVDAGPEHPIEVRFDRESDLPRPYILVRPGLYALILRPVYYRLAEYAEIDASGRLGVWSGGHHFFLEDEAHK
ncbi:MAG: DUF1285 domain-containing protein, partial [Kiloniellales bacterium]|nr:DUF1285 domain-containing protein [Kiloniellales bacterium]